MKTLLAVLTGVLPGLTFAGDDWPAYYLLLGREVANAMPLPMPPYLSAHLAVAGPACIFGTAFRVR